MIYLRDGNITMEDIAFAANEHVQAELRRIQVGLLNTHMFVPELTLYVTRQRACLAIPRSRRGQFRPTVTRVGSGQRMSHQPVCSSFPRDTGKSSCTGCLAVEATRPPTRPPIILPSFSSFSSHRLLPYPRPINCIF